MKIVFLGSSVTYGSAAGGVSFDVKTVAGAIEYILAYVSEKWG
jgi:hypothetical protein